MSVSGLSLTQARELWMVLTECEQKLDTLETKAKKTELSYGDLYDAMQDVFSIVNEMGLPPEVEHAINMIHRLIMAANSLRIALIALDAATVTSPLGWALVGLSFTASFVASLASMGAAINMRQR